MEKRDVLNYLGDKIGELELPIGTSEEVWAKKLALFLTPPKEVTIVELIESKIEQYERTAPGLIREFKRDNTLSGITIEQSAQMFDDFGDVLSMLREGAFPTALYRLEQKVPSGFVTQQMIDTWIEKIKTYL